MKFEDGLLPQLANGPCGVLAAFHAICLAEADRDLSKLTPDVAAKVVSDMIVNCASGPKAIVVTWEGEVGGALKETECDANFDAVKAVVEYGFFWCVIFFVVG